VRRAIITLVLLLVSLGAARADLRIVSSAGGEVGPYLQFFAGDSWNLHVVTICERTSPRRAVNQRGFSVDRHSPDGSYRKLSLLQFGFPGKAELSPPRALPSR
jgi:hypothetical protein